MQITIFGANGAVGRLVVAEALERGHTVVAFVHAHNDLPKHKNLHIAKGDAENTLEVEKALVNSEAIVSALSSWKAHGKHVLSDSMRTIIPLAQGMGIKRLISLTGSDAYDVQDQPSLINKLSHTVLGLIAPAVMQDGEEHIKLLRASNLAWTVVRSPRMIGSQKTDYTLQAAMVAPYLSIPRVAVAKSIVDLLESGEFTQSAPGIVPSRKF